MNRGPSRSKSPAPFYGCLSVQRADYPPCDPQSIGEALDPLRHQRRGPDRSPRIEHEDQLEPSPQRKKRHYRDCQTHNEDLLIMPSGWSEAKNDVPLRASTTARNDYCGFPVENQSQELRFVERGMRREQVPVYEPAARHPCNHQVRAESPRFMSEQAREFRAHANADLEQAGGRLYRDAQDIFYPKEMEFVMPGDKDYSSSQRLKGSLGATTHQCDFQNYTQSSLIVGSSDPMLRNRDLWCDPYSGKVQSTAQGSTRKNSIRRHQSDAELASKKSTASQHLHRQRAVTPQPGDRPDVARFSRTASSPRPARSGTRGDGIDFHKDFADRNRNELDRPRHDAPSSARAQKRPSNESGEIPRRVVAEKTRGQKPKFGGCSTTRDDYRTYSQEVRVRSDQSKIPLKQTPRAAMEKPRFEGSSIYKLEYENPQALPSKVGSQRQQADGSAAYKQQGADSTRNNQARTPSPLESFTRASTPRSMNRGVAVAAY